MRRAAYFIFSWLILTLPGFALAADTADHQTENDFSYSPNWPEPPDTSGMLMRLGFGTVVTMGLCVATLVFGRRWLQRPEVIGTSRQLRIEETVNLGHRATLFLVKVGETQLVAGTDAGGLKSLVALPSAFQEVLDRQVDEPVVASVEASAKPPVVVWNSKTAHAA